MYTLFEAATPSLGFATMALLVNPLELLGFITGALIPYLLMPTLRQGL